MCSCKYTDTRSAKDRGCTDEYETRQLTNAAPSDSASDTVPFVDTDCDTNSSISGFSVMLYDSQWSRIVLNYCYVKGSFRIRYTTNLIEFT